MTKKEIVDKISHWLLIYFDHNKCLPIKHILGEVQLEMSHLMIMLHKGCISDAARAMQESRTTVSERLRLKGRFPDEELKELCAKHSVPFVERRWDRGWVSKEKIAELVEKNASLKGLYKQKPGSE